MASVTMLRSVILVILALAVMPLSSCGMVKQLLRSRKPPPASQGKDKDMFIGVIESVNPEQQFVLVRMDSRLVIAPGTKLDFHSVSGARGTLVVTPERKMNFLSADIAAGAPGVGDVVILPPQPASVAMPVTPGTESAPADAAPASAAPAAGTGVLPPPVP